MDNIPIIIAKFLALPETEGFDIHDKFAYLIKSVDGDSYYLQDHLPEVKVVSEELANKVYEKVTNNISYEDIFDWYKIWTMSF